MVTQPVTARENKKEVIKYALYYSGEYIGYDAYDNEVYCSFNEGWYFKPRLKFVVYDTGRPFDPKTGERRGELETEMSDKEGKWLPYNLNNGPHDCRKKNDK
jgi:hypothetical protein